MSEDKYAQFVANPPADRYAQFAAASSKDLDGRLPALAAKLQTNAEGFPVIPHSLGDRLEGLAARGIMRGITSLVDLPSTAYTLATNKLGYSTTHAADKLATKLGVYAPQSRLEDYAVDGVSLVGPGLAAGTTGIGAKLLPKAARTAKLFASGALSGAASDMAADHGFSPRAQILSGLAAGGAVEAVPQARAALGRGATEVMARAKARQMTLDDAKRTARTFKGIEDTLAGSPVPISDFQASGTFKKDLTNGLEQYVRAASRRKFIDRYTSDDLATAISQAGAHTNGLSATEGSALGQISVRQIPSRQRVLAALDTLNDVSGQQFKTASSGPFASLAQKAAPFVKAGTVAATAMHHPLSAVAELTALAVPGTSKLANKPLEAFGRGLDHVLGTAVTPAMANKRAAEIVLKRHGEDAPKSPLPLLRKATRALRHDPQALFELPPGEFGSPAGLADGTLPFEGARGGYSTLPPSKTGAASVMPETTRPPGEGIAPISKGGHAYANKLLEKNNHTGASADEFESAISDARENGMSEDIAARARAFENLSPETIHYLASIVAHKRGHGTHPGPYDREASEAADRAVHAVPNGPSNRGSPVNNAYRYQSAVDSYRSGIDGLAQTAAAAGHHKAAIALQRIKMVKERAVKEQIRDDLIKALPEMEDYFPPEVMKGIE